MVARRILKRKVVLLVLFVLHGLLHLLLEVRVVDMLVYLGCRQQMALHLLDAQVLSVQQGIDVRQLWNGHPRLIDVQAQSVNLEQEGGDLLEGYGQVKRAWWDLRLVYSRVTMRTQALSTLSWRFYRKVLMMSLMVFWKTEDGSCFRSSCELCFLSF